jgi:hypothetical protein
MLAAPAGAVTTGCTAGQYPNRMASQSQLKVACLADAPDTANHIDIHDTDTAIWHHGTAKAVSLGVSPFNTAPTRAVTASSTTIHFASGVITAADVRRPITALVGTNHLFKGGTFIASFVNATTATISQAACATYGTPAVSCSTTAAVPAKIEMTNSRLLLTLSCTAASQTITTVAPGFTPNDLGKSVSGGPFAAGTYIDVAPGANALTAHINTAPTANCTTNNGGDPTASPVVAPITGQDKINIGSGQYDGGGNAIWNNKDPMGLQLSNTTGGGGGFTCTGTNTLNMTAASVTDTGGFVATDVGLATSLRKTSGATVTVVAGKIATFTSATTVVLGAGQCPGPLPAVSATVSQAMVIGVPGAGAPANGDAMMTLTAELNLSPTLVATQDDCQNGTLEGFQVVGGWQNPGATYAGNASTPKASVSQILFPTSVISFNGFVAPKKGGELVNPDPHYTFTFPLLPTSLAECIDKNGTPATTDDHPLDSTGLGFGMNPTVLAKAPFLPTGSGNIADPAVRTLLGVTGAQTITVDLINNTGPVTLASDNSVCTVVSNTADPGFTCGDG